MMPCEQYPTQVCFSLVADQEITEESQFDFISMEEFMTKTSEVCSKQLPGVVMLHAKHIYDLVRAAEKEFQDVLHKAQHTIKVAFLIQASKHLYELCKMYEDCTDLSQQKVFGEQVAFLFRRYLPELSCVSFKAMKDMYSETMSGWSIFCCFSIVCLISYMHADENHELLL